MGFVVTGAGKDTWITWDDDGLAHVCSPDPAAPRFRATDAAWSRFVSGEFSAVQGVLNGKIEFDGELAFVLPYVDAFNRLAAVARPLIDIDVGS